MNHITLRRKAAVPLAVAVLLILGVSVAHAITYSPGATLTPGCAPTDPDCGVTAPVTTLNGRTGVSQTFAVGTTGTDFGISSAGTTHTFNLPDASATSRGLVTTGTQTFAGAKSFSSMLTLSGSMSMAGSTSGLVTISPAADAGTWTLTLPTGAGTAGQVLTTDGLGATSWVAASAGSQTPWAANINASGYTLFGNSTVGGNLTLDSTSNGTKGYVLINPAGGNVGIGTPTPDRPLTIGSNINSNLIRMRATEGDTAPYDLIYQGFANGAPINDTISWSFNTGGLDATQPEYAENIESRWVTGSGTTNGILEKYSVYTSVDGLTGYRPWSWSLNQDTNTTSLAYYRMDLFRLGNSDDSKVLQWNGATGALNVGTGSVAAATFSGTWAGNAITPELGGTSLNTSASSGIPSINNGNWQVNSPTVAWLLELGESNTIVNSPLFHWRTGGVGRIGLGTTTPQARMEIAQGTGGGSYSLQLTADPSEALGGKGSGLQFSGSKGPGGLIYGTSDESSGWENGRLTLASFNASAEFVDTLSLKNGKVGVGVNTPLYTLDVNGTIRVSGRLLRSQGASVVAANDLTLGTDGNAFHVTGATTINALTTTGWTAGSEVTLIFDSNPTVKNNTAGGGGTAPILLSGGVDFVASANSVLKLIFDGTSNWYEVSRSIDHS